MSSFNPRSSSSGSRRSATRRSAPASTPRNARARSVGSTRAPKRLAPPATGRRRETATVGRLSVAGLGLHDHKKQPLPGPAKAAIAVAAGAAVLVALLLVLSMLPIFVVTTVQADPSEHLSAEDITRLASVDQGTTLLSVDTAKIEQNLCKNPWVRSVTVSRVFPDTLKLTIHEREVFALVTMKSGTTVWYVSKGGTWIEPAQVKTSQDVTTAEAALAKAKKEGCLLIQGVPSSVAPKAGAKITDPSILAVMSYQDAFSEGLRDQIVSYTAASEESVSCVLQSGLEVSLGAPNSISSKEAVITALMAQYPNQLTYINVRNPSKPTYRKIESGAVEGGSGVVPKDEPGNDAASQDGSQNAGQDGAQGDGGQPAAGAGSGSGDGGQGLDAGSDGSGQSSSDGSEPSPAETGEPGEAGANAVTSIG